MRRRIIPARAGFTPPGPSPEICSRDHPRSRGVYAGVLLARPPVTGSSPLARGLPTPSGRRSTRGRIIPARAGFTTPMTRGRRPTGDHPRSRGVYTAVREAAPVARGSSPLARGLRRLPERGLSGLGIIPARAGFTRVLGDAPQGRGDHPRSRGVYAQRTLVHRPDGGSSPLARGLHYFVVRRGATARIIPARAGFTRACSTSTSCRTDHPRSRGVYRPSPMTSGMSEGSSPLARVLRRLARPAGRRPGIIPARAGFTMM